MENVVRSLELTIPAPAVGINQTYKVTQGRLYTAAEAKQYKQDVVMLVRAAMMTQEVEFIKKVPLAIDLHIYLPNNRRDIDSYIKLVIDSLCGAIGVNDRYVFSLSVYKYICRSAKASIAVVIEQCITDTVEKHELVFKEEIS